MYSVQYLCQIKVSQVQIQLSLGAEWQLAEAKIQLHHQHLSMLLAFAVAASVAKYLQLNPGRNRSWQVTYAGT